MKSFKKYKTVLSEIGYYIYALCEIIGEDRIPFYIGKGKHDRCLQHLDAEDDDTRSKKIKSLLKEDRLGIDIIRHGIKTDREAKIIEATCIDLLGVGNLTNKVRGSGVDMGRVTLEEIHNLRSGKTVKIKSLIKHDRLGIDIIRHGIKTDREAKIIEATCIDLLGVGNLTNKVRGSGVDMGRVTLEEIHSLCSGKTVKIKAKHAGIAFLLNSTYKSGMSEVALFESTRGVWHNPRRDESIKYAYATYGGLIKEVYEIHSWVPAGTQQYFERELIDEDIVNRWEFIGKKASQEVRELYIGKILEKDRSFGSPFVYVG